jgi:Fic family protein
MRRIKIYIYQQNRWPHFKWDNEVLLPQLAHVRYLQGKLIGKMQGIGFDLQNEAMLETLTQEVHKTSEIEGEQLNLKQVRSSVARKLGIDIVGLTASSRHVDGVVEMLLDATQHYQDKLSINGLFDWHKALFPTGNSGLFKIKVGQWRDNAKGPMQVVSGVLGKEKVHFQAPEASTIAKEMDAFIFWFNAKSSIDPILKAAIAHLWFITLHPFDDGNGRIARAITEKQLTLSDAIPQRFYSMSAQIQEQREDYYSILEQSQKGNLEITSWIVWFLDCLKDSINSSNQALKKTLLKHHFWNANSHIIFNERQKFMLNILLDGYKGKINSSKWAKLTHCSTDTALRDIQSLIKNKILLKTAKGGRSTAYELLK